LDSVKYIAPRECILCVSLAEFEVAKPLIIATTKTLPFEALEPSEFERLCLWLVEVEGYERAGHLGAAGSDHGHDVIAYKKGALGEEVWCFQCKRSARLEKTTLIKEIDKYGKVAKSLPFGPPVGIVFVTSAIVSMRTRTAVAAYCEKRGYRCEFWARTELDMRVKKHPSILGEFFHLPSLGFHTDPHQLPPCPQDFVGRAMELNALMDSVKRSGSNVGLWGPAGIGKTVAALKLAEQLTSSYAEAQFFLDLRGTSPNPVSPAEAISIALEACGLKDARRQSQADLAALYRSVLYGKHTIIVADNAASASQIELLVPPSGSLLIVTSRHRLILPGLVGRTLKPLPQTDATTLILRIAPRAGAEAQQMAAVCGCWPLALRIAASTLAQREDLSVSNYLKKLRGTRDRFRLIEGSLALSYDLLGAEQRRLWRILAVFPGQFSDQAAAHVWDVGLEAAQPTLSTLLAQNLLEWNPVITRYSLHDLVRGYLESLLAAEERHVAKQRHAEYYRIKLAEAEMLHTSGGEGQFWGTLLFLLERHNIEAGHAWTVEHSQANEAAARLCSDYANSGAPFLAALVHSTKRIFWLESAISAARRNKDAEAESIHLSNLGAALLDIGDVSRAIDSQTLALGIAHDIGSLNAETTAYCNLGVTLLHAGKLSEAKHILDRALDLHVQSGNKTGEATVRINLASVSVNDFLTATKHLERSIDIAQDVSDCHLEASALGTLALVHIQAGHYRKAIRLADRQRRISHLNSDARGEAWACNLLGVSFGKLQKYTRAIGQFRKGVSISSEAGIHAIELRCLNNLAGLFGQPKDFRRAVECYKRMAVIFCQLGRKHEEADMKIKLALKYWIAGFSKEAIQWHEKSLRTFEDLGDLSGQCHTLCGLALAIRDTGDSASARLKAKAALEIVDRLRGGIALELREKMVELAGV
jgi:tetratricopeptide (TPR) repeat protein